ncbi:MAG: beta-mannosidase [Bacteroidales bacterium]|nr:beta-mannosidase [Bacteroidales bacterium]
MPGIIPGVLTGAFRFVPGHNCLFRILLSAILFVSCKPTTTKDTGALAEAFVDLPVFDRPVDSLLTPEARALLINLNKLKSKGILFGQQDATLTGVDWKFPENKSDVKELTGAHPALYGWEIGGAGKEDNIDSIPFQLIRQRMIEAFDRGGINTVSWHLNNPVTGGTAWDVTPALSKILPDSILSDFYKSELQKIAGFFLSLKNAQGNYVPVIFRPFHENNGNWFWWGKGRCSPADYINLWRFTVSYLRDSLHVHNLIYAYSTDMFENEQQYLERYPGNEWADILGCENYWDFQSGSSVSNGVAQLKMLVNMATVRKKIAALTECGFSGIPVKNWWTQFLLKSIREDSLARNISYLMVWRNANRKNYYTPFAGHKSAPDFIAFERDTFTIFEKDLIGIYSLKNNAE